MSFNEEKLLVWMDETDKRLAHLEANQLAIINGDFWGTNTEPKEPLIKDEKIRKAVRAWADATGTKSVNYWGHLESCQNDSSIDFQNGLGLEHGDDYTIAELCGEEGE